MKRLTFKESDGTYGIVGLNESNEREKLLEVTGKLISYEETELEPEEVQNLKEDFKHSRKIITVYPGIQQHIQDGLIVQTELRVIVDGISIGYTRLPDDFAYEFVVNNVISQIEIDIAHEKIRKVVTAMINQSFDHGSSWRETDTKICTDLVERYAQYVETVYFRIRDAG